MHVESIVSLCYESTCRYGSRRSGTQVSLLCCLHCAVPSQVHPVTTLYQQCSLSSSKMRSEAGRMRPYQLHVYRNKM